MKLALLRVSQGPGEVLLGGVEAGHDWNKPNQDADKPTASDETQMSADGRLGLISPG